MLAIRMQRTGRAGHAQFRVIVQDSRAHPKSGRVVEYLGSYNPHTRQAQLNKDSIDGYLKNGAQPSDRVAKLLKKEGLKLPSWVSIAPDKKREVRNPDKRRSTRPPQEQAAEGSTEQAAEPEKAPETESAETPPAEESQPEPENADQPAESQPEAEAKPDDSQESAPESAKSGE